MSSTSDPQPEGSNPANGDALTPADAKLDAPRHRPSIIFIFITLLLDVMGIGLIIPVAPRLVEKLYDGPISNAGIYVGALGATYALFQFMFAPILGALSDRFGRRPVILISLFGSGIDYLAAALAPNLWFLFVTRALNGISGANITACSSYIADITPPEKRAAGFGILGAAFGLGFVIGPVTGGVLGEYDIYYPFYAAAALSLANWVYGYFVLPESLPKERRSKFDLRKAHPIEAIRSLSAYPGVLGVAAVLFLANVAQFALHSTWVLYTTLKFNWSTKQVGFSLFAVGLSSAIVQGLLARKLVPVLGEKVCFLFGIGWGALAFAAYGFATEGWMIYAIVAVASIGGIAGPAGQAIVSQSVPPTHQGVVQGALTSLQSIANIIGPLLGGALFSWFASDAAKAGNYYVPGASLLAGAVIMVGAFLVAAANFRRPWGGAATTQA